MKSDDTVEGILQYLQDEDFKVFNLKGNLTKKGHQALERLIELLYKVNTILEKSSKINVDHIEYQIDYIIRHE